MLPAVPGPPSRHGRTGVPMNPTTGQAMARTSSNRIDESTPTKGQLRKLTALRGFIGGEIGERAFAEWLSSRPGRSGSRAAPRRSRVRAAACPSWRSRTPRPRNRRPSSHTVGALASGRLHAAGSFPARAPDTISATPVRASAGVTAPCGPMVAFTGRPRYRVLTIWTLRPVGWTRTPKPLRSSFQTTRSRSWAFRASTVRLAISECATAR